MKNDFFTLAAAEPKKKALPVLSYPAAQKLGVNLNELAHSAELQARAMEYVAHNTPTLAAVSMMDLSVEAEAFGAEVRFTDWEVPSIIGQLVEDEDGADALAVPSVGAGRTGLCIEAIRKAKELIPDKPVLAGCIGPFSLAGRLMDVTEIMYACYDEPETVHIVLEKSTQFITAYIQALKAAGADGIVLAEPLAGLISGEMASEFSCDYVKQIINAVQTDEFLLVYHNCGNTVTTMLPLLFGMKAAAYHFGNAVHMEEILKNAPGDAICMGNISPADRFANGTVPAMRMAVQALMNGCGKFSNFIPSSGCDIPGNASWDNIMAFFEEIEKQNP